MESKKVKFTLLTWAMVALCAIANGAFRAFMLQPVFDETVARMISCFMLITILLLISYYSLNRTKLKFSDRELMVIGTVWLALTLLFEFGWGHFVVGRSWDELLVDYDILKGRLWVLVLIFTLLAPLIAGRSLRKKVTTQKNRPLRDQTIYKFNFRTVPPLIYAGQFASFPSAMTVRVLSVVHP